MKVQKLADARDPVQGRTRRGRWCGAGGALVILVSAVALGQEAAPSDTDTAMEELRGRAPAGEADDRVLDAWINQELSSLDEAATDPERAKAFRQRFVSQITNPGNTPEFVARLADRVGVLFTPRLADCDKLPPPAARALAGVLRQFDRAGVIDGLEAGLRCANRQDVRYLCAQGFAGLRDNIAVNPVLMERALQILKTAGQAETSGTVASQIYEALSFRSADRLSDALGAMLDVVSSRIERRRTVPVCDGGELTFLEFVRENRPPNRPLTERVVQSLAVMLRLDVTRLEQEGVGEYELARLLASIDATEGLLVELVNPPTPPGVRDALKKGEDVRMLEAKIELNKWIGTPNAPGILNAQPWSVPVGAP